MLTGIISILTGDPVQALALLAVAGISLGAMSPLVVLLDRRRVLRLLGVRIADVAIGDDESARSIGRQEVWTVTVIIAAAVIVSIVSRTLFALALIPVLAYFLRADLIASIWCPYCGCYKNGVLEPYGPWYYADAHSFQREGSVFHVRTKNGAVHSVGIDSNADALEARLLELSIPSTTIVSTGS